MRITILTNGSRGDVQPYVALGLGLQQAGHSVQIATHEQFRTFIRERGLDFFPVAGDFRQMWESEEWRQLRAAGRNRLRLMKEFQRIFEAHSIEFLHDALQACQDAEAILCATHVYFAGEALAEKMQRPLYYASLYPLTPSRFQATMMLPPLPAPLRLLGWLGYNWLTHMLFLKVSYQLARPLRRAYQRVLDLPPRPVWLSMRTFQQGPPFLYGYSRHVVPRPPDWDPRNHVTGYWFLEHAADWRPSPHLVDFLAAGPAPVYVGFGSMKEQDAAQLTEIVVEALRRARQRGVLLTGWGGLGAGKVPDEIFVAEAIPHDWLFPRMAAVVHHGGAGTTAAGLRAGLPSVIVPFRYEQPFWGRRVWELGVGPRPVPRRQLSVERLADAMTAAVSDKEMRRRAQELGDRIRQEDGVARAVEAFEHLCRADHSHGSHR
jgi:UDP:flavonoid glycosyltransferase YjiC (YdhE family)